MNPDTDCLGELSLAPSAPLPPARLPAQASFDTQLADPRRTLDDLISRALAYRTGPELKQLVEFTRRFPHIAPYNAMLLHVQNPGIGYALRAFDWERKYARRVKPAVRPYVILWTMGPVAFVFDLSDTEPINPSDERVPECVTNPFPAKGQPPPGTLDKLMAACLKIGIDIGVRDFGTNLAGRVQRVSKPKKRKLTAAEQACKDAAGDLFGEWESTADFHIALNSKHTPAQQLGTLAHELAHIFCGHLGITDQAFWTDRSDTQHDTREVEAEVVAYFVTERMSLDIGSVSYLAGYVKPDQPLPSYSLDAVLKAVGKIEDMLKGRFRPKKVEAASV